ncbi:hypothetical protein PCE1_002717 [Barthelona sp. PCE]
MGKRSGIPVVLVGIMFTILGSGMCYVVIRSLPTRLADYQLYYAIWNIFTLVCFLIAITTMHSSSTSGFLNTVGKVCLLFASFYVTLFLATMFYGIFGLFARISLFFWDYYVFLDIKYYLYLFLQVGYFLYTFLALFNRISLRFLKKLKVQVEFDDINLDLEQIRIAAISDTHLDGFFGDKSMVYAIEDKVKEIAPDLLLNLGDIVDTSIDRFKAFVQTEGIGMPFVPKKIAVGGNHDSFHTLDNDSERVLEDILQYDVVDKFEHITIKSGNATIAVTGVNYMNSKLRKYEIEKLREIMQKDVDLVLCMVHEPGNPFFKDVRKVIEDYPDCNLIILSGHTHAGQIFGFHWIVKLFFATTNAWGLKKMGKNAYSYVNAGTSTWFIPLSLWTLNGEVTQFSIVKRKGSAIENNL